VSAAPGFGGAGRRAAAGPAAGIGAAPAGRALLAAPWHVVAGRAVGGCAGHGRPVRGARAARSCAGGGSGCARAGLVVGADGGDHRCGGAFWDAAGGRCGAGLAAGPQSAADAAGRGRGAAVVVPAARRPTA
jgi:hypothetical protein